MKKQWKQIHSNGYTVSFNPIMGYKIWQKVKKFQLKSGQWVQDSQFTLTVHPDSWVIARHHYAGVHCHGKSGLHSIDPQLVNCFGAIFDHWKRTGKRTWNRNAAIREADLILFKDRKDRERSLQINQANNNIQHDLSNVSVN